MTFEVKRMTQKASKEHNEMVDSCIRDAKGWVAETRDNMQLWKQTDHDRDPSDATDEKEEVIYTWKQWEAQIELVVGYHSYPILALRVLTIVETAIRE